MIPNKGRAAALMGAALACLADEAATAATTGPRLHVIKGDPHEE